ncbi:MAG: biotin/lipoyl-binding protein [Firmicutes bacterium]|nr:biotin/lipoyl-binding protein [Bacillota bacterium]
MRTFVVTVNGEKYEVVVEETGDDVQIAAPTPVAAKSAAVSKPAPKATPAPQPKPAAKPVAGAGSINAPMPGTILSIKVSAGQTVKKGDVLLTLEAMKMENEIMAPTDGTVTEIFVSVGQSVNTGDVLLNLA